MSGLFVATALFVTTLSAPASFQQAEIAAPPPPRVEIDQALITQPTTATILRHHSYFRLTHRFARDLGRGDFGDLAQDLFSLDNGAIIGLEYRYGITSRVQAGVHRTILGKTIEAFGRVNAVQQGHAPVSAALTLGYEGQNNLKQDYQPSAAITVSRTFGPVLALYATPTYVHDAHTATLRAEHEGHEHDVPGQEDDDEDHSSAVDTWFVGLGARVRVRPTVYLVGEASPRLGGYTPARATWAVGVEKTTRGHVLQLNFGNSFNTTPGQIARGGDSSQVFMGFNLSRRF
jgi:hypothetical protein